MRTESIWRRALTTRLFLSSIIMVAQVFLLLAGLLYASDSRAQNSGGWDQIQKHYGELNLKFTPKKQREKTWRDGIMKIDNSLSARIKKYLEENGLLNKENYDIELGETRAPIDDGNGIQTLKMKRPDNPHFSSSRQNPEVGTRYDQFGRLLMWVPKIGNPKKGGWYVEGNRFLPETSEAPSIANLVDDIKNIPSVIIQDIKSSLFISGVIRQDKEEEEEIELKQAIADVKKDLVMPSTEIPAVASLPQPAPPSEQEIAEANATAQSLIRQQARVRNAARQRRKAAKDVADVADAAVAAAIVGVIGAVIVGTQRSHAPSAHHGPSGPAPSSGHYYTIKKVR